ncbi:MAG: SidJ-related pseudokinase [Deltaproteobacteria bacterium]|nr:SidJ-related pseudokinase [Deltaproteobacteria bacterium]
MHEPNLAAEQRILTDRVQNAGDFAGAYLAVRALHGHIRRHGPACAPDTAIPLENLIRADRFSSETQAVFLYREAAEALVTLVKGGPKKTVGLRALNGLNSLLSATRGHPLRATAEALAALPVAVRGPRVEQSETAPTILPAVTWAEIIAKAGCRTAAEKPRRIGRSLVRPGPHKDTLLVVKCARHAADIELIHNEIRWMAYLRDHPEGLLVRFDVPEPIRPCGSEVFVLSDAPEEMKKTPPASPNGCCGIAFVAHQDYFVYPNAHHLGRRPDPEWFLGVICQNAYLFGRLCALGIVHQAPIPLFHNRVQSNRRQDRGLYEWHRGGRLDRWLHSCRHPNFGPTGVRDFEHFMSFSGAGTPLYHHIGSHLLALLLTTGSYFRFKDTARIGTDPSGAPVDVRDLFDPEFFQRLIEAVFGQC